MKMKLKDVFMRPTKEYSGGLLAGAGIGILALEIISRRTDLIFSQTVAFAIGFLFIIAGSALARIGQQKYKIEIEGHSSHSA